MNSIEVEGELVDDASPNAAALIESLRAIGYDFPTALADLVDNSVGVQASTVWIDFTWRGSASTVAIRDNGTGMSDEELLEAMRLGSTSPRAVRAATDMGRFGLGLKTASFSQCRLVAIRSRQDNGPGCERCWDLDLVERTNRWFVRRSFPQEIASDSGTLPPTGSGTLIVWSRLDRVVGDCVVSDDSARDHFYRVADEACRHLEITFSDYIRRGELKIIVNGTPLKSWDPFLAGHQATQEVGVEDVALGESRVRIAAYVLPHFSKLTTADYELAAGPDGWLASQGFYIYRNKRLLVAADWLGLGFRKERHHELARIRVDISNATDDDWQLDVKKSHASPPPSIRPHLKRIARITRARASEVYKHRGARLVPKVGSDRMFLWVPSRRHGKTFYRLERSHPIVQAAGDSCGDPEVFDALLRLLEETVPTPLIAVDSAEEPKGQAAPFEGVAASEILKTMRAVYSAMREMGQTKEDATRRLAHIEPFDRFPELLATFKPTD